MGGRALDLSLSDLSEALQLHIFKLEDPLLRDELLSSFFILNTHIKLYINICFIYKMLCSQILYLSTNIYFILYNNLNIYLKLEVCICVQTMLRAYLLLFRCLFICLLSIILFSQQTFHSFQNSGNSRPSRKMLPTSCE